MEKRTREKTPSALPAVFGIGGIGYNLLELLWRGRTHWSMTVAGGLCLCILYGIHRALPARHRTVRYFLSAISITAVELAVGCVVNLWWKLGVWDYGNRPFNLLGQICLLYSGIWLLISVPCDVLCGKIEKIFVRGRLSGENPV